MKMETIRRPNPKENEEDLLQQNKVFLENFNKNADTSNKAPSFGKRKNDEIPNSTQEEDERNATKPKSRFAEAQSKKKKKEGIVDRTVLEETDRSRATVLSPIVVRNVPSLSHSLVNWQPTPNLHGFPQAPKLDLSESATSTSAVEPSIKKKSLYMKQMEEMGFKLLSQKVEETHLEPSNDDKLALLGNQSFILDPNSSCLPTIEETEKIHKENISKLSEMSHEERLKARNEIMSQLSAEKIDYILSIRQKKQLNEDKSKIIVPTPLGKTELPYMEDVAEVELSKSQLVNEDGAMKHVLESENLREETKNENIVSEEPMDQQCCGSEDDTILPGLPIQREDTKKWLHMNKVEMEKLKWTMDVPKPVPLKGKEGFIARFNFQGDLLPYDSDISWREGLHHHGEEPGRAGYTLDELFLFCRSQVIQQRHLGLKTLANILRNANEGLYDRCFDSSIIQLMIDAGIILILRFAIDETTALVFQEALRAMYFLLSNEPDERCLTLAEPWTPLGVQPGISSLTHSKDADREELDNEEKELKDIEVLKLDAIRALVRMDVHIRLRYYLESVDLSPPDVVHILGTLKRIARHSLTAAWTLVRTPRLLDTIIKHFIPHNTTSILSGGDSQQLTSVYGVPLSHALSLMKVLASRGREIAVTLGEKRDLMSRVMSYVCLEAKETNMPPTEVLSLTREAYGLWSSLISYGLKKPQEAIRTFYPLFVKQLIFYRDKVDVNDEIESNLYNYEIGATMIDVLTKALSVAATQCLLTKIMKSHEISEMPPLLDWEEFNEILILVEICLTKWISQLSRTDPKEVSFSSLKLVGSCCNFLRVYLENWLDQKNFGGVVFVKKIETLFAHIFIKLFSSKETCDVIFENLKRNSALCSTLKSGKCREANNLGSLWSVCEGGEVTPILQKDSMFPLMFPLTNLLKTMLNEHASLDTSPIASVLRNEHLLNYFKSICSSRHFLASQWFTRIEIYTISNILQIAATMKCDDYILYHQTALVLMPLIHKGDEQLVRSLLVNVVCNLDFVKDLCEIDTQINALSVTEFKTLKSPSQRPIEMLSITELTARINKYLPSIGQNLVKNLLHSKLLDTSAARGRCIPFVTKALSIDRDDDVHVLDEYWCLSPLKLLLLLNDSNKETAKNQSSPETTLSVIHWLQMAFLLLKYRKTSVFLYTSPMGWIRHLSNVFLAANDLFLDMNLTSYIQACLIAILGGKEDGWTQVLEPSWVFPDFQPCLEWYKRMIDQFSSVSYGDSTFAMFIILPLLRQWPISYKLTLFGESSDCVLPFIRLTSDEVSQYIPLEKFLFPPEEDENVIIKYKSAIGRKFISEERNPFLYNFTLHHIKAATNTR